MKGFRVCSETHGVRHYTPADDDPAEDVVSVPERAKLFDEITDALAELAEWRPSSNPFIVAVTNSGVEIPVYTIECVHCGQQTPVTE